MCINHVHNLMILRYAKQSHLWTAVWPIASHAIPSSEPSAAWAREDHLSPKWWFWGTSIPNFGKSMTNHWVLGYLMGYLIFQTNQFRFPKKSSSDSPAKKKDDLWISWEDHLSNPGLAGWAIDGISASISLTPPLPLWSTVCLSSLRSCFWANRSRRIFLPLLI